MSIRRVPRCNIFSLQGYERRVPVYLSVSVLSLLMAIRHNEWINPAALLSSDADKTFIGRAAEVLKLHRVRPLDSAAPGRGPREEHGEMYTVLSEEKWNQARNLAANSYFDFLE